MRGFESIKGKEVEFDPFKKEAGANSFTLFPNKWIENKNGIRIIFKQGKNGGTFTNKDIAFELACWVSSAFKRNDRLKTKTVRQMMD